jgi:L-alanine-DL-glutamate epimerase-like enolase superfamily enzyme
MPSRSARDFTIRAASVRALDVPLRRPFGIAGGALPSVANLLVEVELVGGVRGFGEAAPFPAFNGETRDSARAAIERALPGLVGKDVRPWAVIAAELGAAVPSASGACAIEMAIVDALTRALGVSLRTWIGGAEDELTTDVTITTGSVDDATRDAIAWREFTTLKIKVGGGDVERDVARVLAIARARPDARLMLDANAGFSGDEAVQLATALRKRDVVPVLFEQPTHTDPAAMADTRARLDLPVALDEAIVVADDVVRCARGRLGDVVNIKLQKSGICGALDIAAAARAHGLGLMMGGMVETRLATGAAACLAAGLGGFAFVDLDTPLFLADDPIDGGYAQRGERIDLRPIAAGHGATPKR